MMSVSFQTSNDSRDVPQVNVVFDANQIEVGRVVPIDVVLFDGNMAYLEGPVPGTRLGDFLVVGATDKHSRAPGEMHLSVVPLRPGDCVLPGFKVSIESSTAPETSLYTAPQSMVVQSALAPGEPLVLMDPMVPVTLEQEAISNWVAYGLGVLLLMVAFVVWRRKKRRPTQARGGQDEARIVHPEQWALDLLSRLSDRSITEDQVALDVLAEIGDVLRRYLDIGVEKGVMVRTTTELKPVLSRLGMRDGDFVRDVLEDVDLAKYARRVPAAAHVNEVLVGLRRWITSRQDRMEGGMS